IRSARSQPGARAAPADASGARQRVTRSMTKDDEALVEKEEVPVLLFSDSEEEQQEELVGIEKAHSARVEALSARGSMMMRTMGRGEESTLAASAAAAAALSEPMLHSTPNRLSSHSPHRASARLSRLAGMSPIRRRESAGVAPFGAEMSSDGEEEEMEEREEGEPTMGAPRSEGRRMTERKTRDASPMAVSSQRESTEEEEAEKMSVEESGDDEEDRLVESIERSMVLEERTLANTVAATVAASAAGDDTAMVTMQATMQATLMMDTVAGYGNASTVDGAGTMMFENTMAGYGDGTVATLAEEYGAETLMMGGDASVLPHAATSALQLPPHRRTTLGNETLDVSMASVASAATRNASMMSRRNMTQITNDSSRFADELPFYLADFVGETALEQLLHVVGQDEVREWRKQLPKDTLKQLKKLGEGTYGEVYATTMNGAPVAMKIIPFEDDIQYFDGVVNGETLKNTAEIIPEVLITRELSALNNDAANFSTSCFIPLVQCHVVRGNYPKELLKEWDAYDKRKGSENDRPSLYAHDQALFLAIGLALGGVDVEAYKVRSEKEALSALFQLALALVVAEEQLEFEHRDLHIGNVLIAQVPEEEEIKFRLMGSDVHVKSHGVKLSIIDFTNSRLRKEGTTIFIDLEHDEELFQGEGDYQFDVYRLMREHNRGDWRSFAPKSNIYWLHYMAKELILEERKKTKAKEAKAFTKKRRAELFSVFDALPNFDLIKVFLNTTEVYDIMKEYVRFEATE
ncbi:hypothetical protein PFISCL1PPCAC_17390, partial [Pristionchus fissidentatus]